MNWFVHGRPGHRYWTIQRVSITFKWLPEGGFSYEFVDNRKGGKEPTSNAYPYQDADEDAGTATAADAPGVRGQTGQNDNAAIAERANEMLARFAPGCRDRVPTDVRWLKISWVITNEWYEDDTLIRTDTTTFAVTYKFDQEPPHAVTDIQMSGVSSTAENRK